MAPEPTSTVAAVMRAAGAPMTVESITVQGPAAGEVLVEMVAAGVCGSDLHVRDGQYPVALPGVGGHEGAGIVREVGPGVTELVPGDHVVQLFVSPCGECRQCRRGRRTFCAGGRLDGGTMADGGHRLFDADGQPLGSHLGLAGFSALTVCPVRSLVRIDSDVPLEVAALVSCGVSTGVGAVVNVAGVGPGDDVVVVGLGGVGAAAVMGAVVAGAARIIVVDVNPDKEALASQLGATHFVDARTEPVVEAISTMTDGLGADAVVLAPNQVRPEHFGMAVESLGVAGVVVQVGGAHGQDAIPVAPAKLMGGQKSIVGTTFGGLDPARDVGRWLDLYQAGRLPIERLITRRYAHGDINEAFADLEAGRNLRGVVIYQ